MNKGFYVLSFMIILVSWSVYSIMVHENLHRTIGKEAGCINDTINYNFFGRSYWLCNEYEAKEIKLEKQIHLNHEIVSYNFNSLSLLVSMLFFWGVYLLKNKNE